MQEYSRLLSNELPRQLSHYNNWKVKSTKLSAEILSKNQLNAEKNLRLKQIQSVRKEPGSIQGFTIFMQEDSQWLPNKLPSLK